MMLSSEAITAAPAHVRQIGWALLGGLLAAMFLGSVFYDRSSWPVPAQLPGEATFLMQARSLAEDLDLVYTRTDFDRMLLSDLGNPTDLSLVSLGGGRRITFDRPFPYALYLAPFLKLWPRQGFAIANALLLMVVSVFAAKTLERFAGPWAALWTAILIFGSALFVYVFLATGDLFLFAMTVLAFCLIARGQPIPGEQGVPGEQGARSKNQPVAPGGSRRWFLAGALLAIPAASEALYTVLVAAAFFAPPKKDRGLARSALVLGFLLCLILILVVSWFAGGGPALFGASQFRFTPETGYPLVDFTAAEWPQTVRRLSALHWDEAPRFAWGVDLRLWAWDGLYLLFGQAIGLVPYFAPLLLMVFTGSLAGFRRPIAFAALAWGLGVVILHPFNLYGGEGAVANRLFLPIYGALWMLLSVSAGQTRRWARPVVASPVVALAVVALAAPFMWRLWTSPWSYPIEPGGGARHVTAAAAILPYEVSQRWLQDGQPSDHNGLMVKFLSDHGWEEARRGRLMIEGTEPVELLVASIEPLDTFRFDFGEEAPSGIRFAGGTMQESLLQPGGGISFRVSARSRGRHHPMWWSPQPHWFYLLTVELPEATEGALGFTLFGERYEDA